MIKLIILTITGIILTSFTFNNYGTISNYTPPPDNNPPNGSSGSTSSR